MSSHNLRLQTLPDDILVVICQEIQSAHVDSLGSISRVSRRLRSICMPILFKCCYPHYVEHTSSHTVTPPEAIRTHVRQIAFCGIGPVGINIPYATSLRTYLRYLPNVVHIRLLGIAGGPTAELIDVCLERVASLEVDFSSRWAPVPSDLPSGERYTRRNLLARFQYRTHTYRDSLSGRGPLWSLKDEYAMEARCLARFVCDMHTTVESLSLPMETAPLLQMQDLEWPRIRSFSLYGRYDSLSLRSGSVLPAVLSRMPSLRTLHVQATQHQTLARAPIFGRSPNAQTEMVELQSLTVAYPDPEDVLFCRKAPLLTRLSLRDEPRRYIESWDRPLLRAWECLYILRKFVTPGLESLELVYEADHCEDDLMRHISSHYPRLARLELHRYRAQDDEEDVPYRSMMTTISSITSLQSLHLNLGFREMPPVRCNDFDKCESWARFRDIRAQEILAIMQSCPKMEYVALLNPRYRCCTWVEYRFPWYPGPSIDLDVELVRADSDWLPYRR